MKNSSCIALLLLAVVGCREKVVISDVQNFDVPFYLEYPAGFPELDIPDDNLLTVNRVNLGKQFFFDRSFSSDGMVSCGTCHLPSMAFTDGLSLSEGFEGRTGMRNAPSLANIGYHERLFWDGGSSSLEVQILAPIADPNEFNSGTEQILEITNQNPEYRRLAKLAYDRDEVDMYVISRALTAYQRTLISGNSRYDQFYYQNSPNALSSQELEGLALFNSDELACASCHSGFNFTDLDYHNIGLYTHYEDPGRSRISDNAADSGKFKTPSLRNVSETGPYMHNGSIETLEEVVDHFASGGVFHTAKDSRIQGFDLTADQKSALIAFLNSLTDHEFINNPAHRP